MQEAQKSLLLEETKKQLNHVREKLHAVISHRDQKTKEMAKGALSLAKDDAWVQQYLAWHNQLQVENLKLLYPSPYFTRCDFEVNGEKKEIYIGKFSFADERIYSWVSPAATLRFENTGLASYKRPDGTVRKGILERKDQYMIVDGKFLFYAKEEMGQSRELIYQEHFTRQKQGFVLEEVVDQMEKAQDQVIRIAYKGPMVISGPAGSGKTTLALHRVAFLMQSPETAEWFQPETIAVLVQDVGTKEYFSQLLPEG